MLLPFLKKKKKKENDFKSYMQENFPNNTYAEKNFLIKITVKQTVKSKAIWW